MIKTLLHYIYKPIKPIFRNRTKFSIFVLSLIALIVIIIGIVFSIKNANNKDTKDKFWVGITLIIISILLETTIITFSLIKYCKKKELLKKIKDSVVDYNENESL